MNSLLELQDPQDTRSLLHAIALLLSLLTLRRRSGLVGCDSWENNDVAEKREEADKQAKRQASKKCEKQAATGVFKASKKGLSSTSKSMVVLDIMRGLVQENLWM
ncbi:hypothetical protein LIER_36583 [Lithospermum erythrorhizon]|uniref:Uncharacterized protein n=1 Tax=Lithospermum erythrorhizon TaxID=34254 RepID=A0AAV3P7W6_LITER